MPRHCTFRKPFLSATMANQSRAAITQANPIGDGLKRFYDSFDQMLKEIDGSGSVPRCSKVDHASISQQISDANRGAPDGYHLDAVDTVARIKVAPFNTRQ